MAKADTAQNKIGGALKARRTRLGISLQQTAKLAGLEPSLLSRIERGVIRDVKLTNIAALAGVLKFSIDALAVEAGLLPRGRKIGADGISELDLAPVADDLTKALRGIAALQKRARELRRLITDG